jgi:putative endonuclease
LSLPGLTRQSIGAFQIDCGRVFEHREGLIEGFTTKYGVKRLVYCEQYEDPTNAIQREKNIKHWSRKWKIDLIRGMNPEWRDLYNDIIR